MEILWVGFHFAGLEWTEVGENVRSIADIHLAHMPWSHSVLMTGVVAALFAVLGILMWKRMTIALALGAGVLSHIVLDLLTHAPDIQLAPFMGERYGLGFYGAAPVIAFFIELAYGLAIWRWVGGGKGLLALILIFNALSLTFYMPFLPFSPFMGDVSAYTGIQLAGIVAVQIALTLPLTYFLAPGWMRASVKSHGLQDADGQTARG
jgi:hypothetical protein